MPPSSVKEEAKMLVSYYIITWCHNPEDQKVIYLVFMGCITRQHHGNN